MSRAARRSAAALSDTELIAELARGELAALGALFERHEPLVRRYLGRLGIDASDADDLVQGTFLEAMRAAGRYDPSYFRAQLVARYRERDGAPPSALAGSRGPQDRGLDPRAVRRTRACARAGRGAGRGRRAASRGRRARAPARQS